MAVKGHFKLEDASLLLVGPFLQSRCILHGVFVVRVGGHLRGSSERSGGAAFTENIAAPVVFCSVLGFKSAPLFVEFSGEEEEGGLPSFVCAFLLIIQKPGLEEATHIHLLDEVDNFIVVCDADAMIATFDLAAIKRAGEGGDVGVGSVAIWSVEMRLDGDLFAARDDKPCPELAEHGF